MTTDRKLLEASFHDRERALPVKPSNGVFYNVTRKSYANILTRLMTIKRGKVLDYCCGNGYPARDFARLGFEVTGIDISPVSIANARNFALKERIEVAFMVGDAENTPFPGNYFDAVTCLGCLHHLDLDKAYSEIARILKPGGKLFCEEPLRYNPIFQLYRKRTPDLRTAWEQKHILSLSSVKLAERYGLKVERVRFFHLFTLLAVPFHKARWFKSLLSVLERIDSIVLRIPGIQLLAWQVFFELRKA